MNTVAKRLAHIHRQSFPQLQAWSEQSFAELLVQAGVMLYQQADEAFLLTRIVADEMEMLTIAVLPGCRRQGRARALWRQALKDMERQVVKQCFLEVDEHNHSAICFYQSIGFEVVATRNAYYQTSSGRSDALVMRLLFK